MSRGSAPRQSAAWCLGVVTLVLAGCYGGSLSAGASTAAPGETSASRPDVETASPETKSSSPDSADGCGSATLSIEYPPGTTATFVEYGWNLVVADVVGFGDAIFNTPDGRRPEGFGLRPAERPDNDSRPTIYTPVEIEIDRALSGPFATGRSRVLIQGGTVGCFTLRVNPSPDLKAGAEYVFFLSDASNADGLELLPEAQIRFAWPVDSEGRVNTFDGVLTIDQLADVVDEAIKLPNPFETIGSG